MNRFVVYGAIGLTILSVLFVAIITRSSPPKSSTRAQSQSVSAYVNPQSQPIANGEKKIVTFSIIPDTAAVNIHGVSLTFHSSPGIWIRDFPVMRDENGIAFESPSDWIDLQSSSSAQLVKIFDPLSGIPKQISVDVLVEVNNTAAKQAYVELDTSLLSDGFTTFPISIVGADEYMSTYYDWNTVERAEFIIYPGPVTPYPTASITLPPTPTVFAPSISPTPTVTPPLTPIVTLVPSGFQNAPSCGSLATPINLWPGGVVVLPQNGLELHWDAVNGASFYVVEIYEPDTKQTSTGTLYKLVFSAPTYTNSFVYTNFKAGGDYLWKVGAIDSCGGATDFSQLGLHVAGLQPTDPARAYPTATPTPALPPVTINMRIRFQAIYNQPQGRPPAPKVFLVFVKNDDRENPIYKWTTAQYDGIGSWIISEPFTMVPGEGYKVWVKGERYLMRKICDGKPSDQESGWYSCANDNGNITIYPGQNYLDFSNIMLFAGDIPFKGEGDGVLDSFDLSYIVNHFGDTANDTADLNFDGITDSQDFAIAVNALRVQKQDETFPYKIHPFFRKVPLHPEFL